MRKYIYLLLTAATFSLAGVYQSEVLMVLFLAEAVLFLLLFFLSRLGMGRVSAEVKMEKEDVMEGEKGRGWIWLKFGSVFYPSYCKVLLEYKNTLSQQENFLELEGGSGRERKLGFLLEDQCCGIARITILQISGYDSLRLFAKRKLLERETKMIILPEPVDAEILFRAVSVGQESWIEDSFVEEQRGGEYDSLRDFRPGDSLRDIHWKLSTKNDELLSKRYMTEGESGILLFLEIRDWWKVSREQAFAFLRIASSLSLAFLKEGNVLDLIWEEETGDREMLVADEEDHRLAMGALMEELERQNPHLEYGQEGEQQRENIQEMTAYRDNVMLRLDCRLRLFLDQEELGYFLETGEFFPQSSR